MVEAFNRINKAWMERVKWAAQTAEQNSQDLYVAVNTILSPELPEYSLLVFCGVIIYYTGKHFEKSVANK